MSAYRRSWFQCYRDLWRSHCCQKLEYWLLRRATRYLKTQGYSNFWKLLRHQKNIQLTDWISSVVSDLSQPAFQCRLGIGYILAVAEIVAVRVPGDVSAWQKDFLVVVVKIRTARRQSSGTQRRPTAEQQRNKFKHSEVDTDFTLNNMNCSLVHFITWFASLWACVQVNINNISLSTRTISYNLYLWIYSHVIAIAFALNQSNCTR